MQLLQLLQLLLLLFLFFVVQSTVWGILELDTSQNTEADDLCMDWMEKLYWLCSRNYRNIFDSLIRSVENVHEHKWLQFFFGFLYNWIWSCGAKTNTEIILVLQISFNQSIVTKFHIHISQSYLFGRFSTPHLWGRCSSRVYEKLPISPIKCRATSAAWRPQNTYSSMSVLAICRRRFLISCDRFLQCISSR